MKIYRDALLGNTGTPDNSNRYVTQQGGQFPVGFIFLSVVSTNPNTLLGYGTWVAFGAGRVLVGLDPNDTAFDVPEKTGGAKTVVSTGSVAAPTLSGNTAAEASHTHSVTSNVAVTDHAAHTHPFTQSSNAATPDLLAASATGSAVAAAGTTGNPSATLTHAVTNNAVTSGAGASHLHGAGTLAASAPAYTGNATSVLQPYIVVYMFKRTA